MMHRESVFASSQIDTLWANLPPREHHFSSYFHIRVNLLPDITRWEF